MNHTAVGVRISTNGKRFYRMEKIFYLHGDDGARNEFPMITDGEMPGSYPHQIVKVELNNETTLRVNLK